MIRTPPASNEYRDNWERVFRGVDRNEETAPLSGDVVAEIAESAQRVGSQPAYICIVCKALVDEADLANHAHPEAP